MLFIALLFALRLTPDAPEVPLKQPQIAVQESNVLLTYGAGNAIYFARSSDGGKTFGKAVKVAEQPFLYLGRHRGPRIVVAGKALVITAISAAERGKGDLLAYRSTDGGKTWSAGTAVSDVTDAAREGLHTTAADANGLIWTVWLDLRQKGMRLYGSTSKDAGKTWSKNELVYESPDGHICECCHPTAYIGPKGELHAMWRNWLGGSRDFYHAVSSDGKTWSVEKVGKGTWQLNACPMDGGGFAISNGVEYSTWRREDTIYLTTGEKPETVIGKGKDSSLAATREGAFVIYQHENEIFLKTPSAEAPKKIGKGGFPVLAGSGPVYATWEDDGAITVERVQ